jgi:hypothetical protein
MPVRPVVVVWGAEQHRFAGGLTQADGIDFVAGHQLRTALRQLEGEVVSKGAAAQMKAALMEFRETCVVLNTEDPTGAASPPPMASPPSLNWPSNSQPEVSGRPDIGVGSASFSAARARPGRAPHLIRRLAEADLQVRRARDDPCRGGSR